MSLRTIQTALISVYHKDGLEPVLKALERLGVSIWSTGGTLDYIKGHGMEANSVESLTSYPSILDGRVKTLHPMVFGGILARRESEDHLSQLQQYGIPPFDLVIVDLYPFEQTLASTTDEAAIIEKIDIGGISLIRAAAKNYRDVVIVASRDKYSHFLEILDGENGSTTLAQRQELAAHAFAVSSQYDTAIYGYFSRDQALPEFRYAETSGRELRYGENPHQRGWFHGPLEELLEPMQGRPLSYNNLIDIDAAVQLMREFQHGDPAFAVLKHTNPCGLAQRPTLGEAWEAALAGDPVSAFGGILICNRPLDAETAQAINKLFYEVLIAPAFEEGALEVLGRKKKRIVLQIKSFDVPGRVFRKNLNGVIEQETDLRQEGAADLQTVTLQEPTVREQEDLLFAMIAAKHLKSNAIALVNDRQLLGIGCGQTSRVDALRQAIAKATQFGFDLTGAVMASDAFFPFPDCVEIADKAGIKAVIQPGGSVRDQESIDYCDAHGMRMVFTGARHFRH
jgi:phosphoribosylaminoimidazolecarboxamide formyltransferase/IMP cyclohydrolase